MCIAIGFAAAHPFAQSQDVEEPRDEKRPAAVLFAAGVASGLLAHEGGHLLFDVVFDADPAFRRVEFGGVPFFAITHRPDLSPRREFTISSAGFWTQHALTEWILTARPNLRHESSPYLKGVLAWHLASSAIYTAAALGRIGPHERDTRGMASAAGVSERWIGVFLLVPAVCDVWRYFDPDARWPRWISRSVKVGLVVSVAAAGR